MEEKHFSCAAPFYRGKIDQHFPIFPRQYEGRRHVYGEIVGKILKSIGHIRLSFETLITDTAYSSLGCQQTSLQAQ